MVHLRNVPLRTHSPEDDLKRERKQRVCSCIRHRLTSRLDSSCCQEACRRLLCCPVLNTPSWTHRLQTGVGIRTLSADIHNIAFVAPRKHLGKPNWYLQTKFFIGVYLTFCLYKLSLCSASCQDNKCLENRMYINFPNGGETKNELRRKDN